MSPLTCRVFCAPLCGILVCLIHVTIAAVRAGNPRCTKLEFPPGAAGSGAQVWTPRLMCAACVSRAGCGYCVAEAACAHAVATGVDGGGDSPCERWVTSLPECSGVPECSTADCGLADTLAVAAYVDERLLAGPGGTTASHPNDFDVAFPSVAAFWKATLRELRGPMGWYARAQERYARGPASVAAMVGRPEASFSEGDLGASARFIAELRRAHPELGRAAVLDAGAGIGRVAWTVLAPVFDAVDVMEPVPKLLRAARASAPSTARNFYGAALQTFVPDVGAYDMVWLNWSLMYLLDADIVTALTRAAEALRPGGFVVVKENMLPLPGAFRVDTAEGFNFFKSRDYWRALWERAGLTEVTSRRSEPWPEDWIPVDMIALRLLAHTREFVVTKS